MTTSEEIMQGFVNKTRVDNFSKEYAEALKDKSDIPHAIAQVLKKYYLHYPDLIELFEEARQLFND